MKIEKLIWRRIFTLIIVLTCFNCLVYGQIIRKKTTSLIINIEHFVGNQKLKLDSINYTNILGQQFTITKFKYYISNISLTKKNGVEFQTNQVFLIDQEDTLTKTIELNNIPTDEYTAIHFTIGVDSLKNCNGAQTGTLDPINGMFWTWNTGYIFLKLEGRSNSSSATDGLIEYHIGGFKQPINAIRTVSLTFDFPLNLTLNDKKTIEIVADILEILKTPNDIDFNKLPIVTSKENAIMMCENYKDMFKLKAYEKN